ncbi:hypothetical protein ATO6_24350, partial [Oceanicola sp. 22II-s10i]|uniref:hypothetical protein n=1 Tax=Oceanicola sp. 22II-s10i TaxID=1317116 RepID=UPI000B6948DB
GGDEAEAESADPVSTSTDDGPAADEPLPTEDGLADDALDAVTGDGGVVDTVAGEDGVVSGLLDTVAGEDGIVSTVLDTLAGDEGPAQDLLDTVAVGSGLLGDVGEGDGILGSILGGTGLFGMAAGTGVADVTGGDESVASEAAGVAEPSDHNVGGSDPDGEAAADAGAAEVIVGAEAGVGIASFDAGGEASDAALEAEPSEPEEDFLETLLFDDGGPDLLEGLLGDDDIYATDVPPGVLEGDDDLFAGLGSEYDLSGTLVDEALIGADSDAADAEIDDLLVSILGSPVDGDITSDAFSAFDALLGDVVGLENELGSGIEPGDETLLGDDAVDGAMSALFGGITEETGGLLGGLGLGTEDENS